MNATWWKTQSDRGPFTGYGLERKVPREVKGLIRLLRLKDPKAILDLCCGSGRHAIPLALLGHDVTGFDWSRRLLAEARRAARRSGVSLNLVRGDARRLPFRGRFDVVINMFTSFGYSESEDEDLRVLRGVRKSLKKGGSFLIDVLNREWLVRHFSPSFSQRKSEGGIIKASHRQDFDLRTGRLTTERSLLLVDGKVVRSVLSFTVYSLRELSRLLEAAGLRLEGTYGDFAGRPYGLDTKRMILVART
ncbi:MAG TPA: class I SAM-dependent methyltransferase [bacterium]|nr:class I SAM-dependent methyltransferase [bacterium]